MKVKMRVTIFVILSFFLIFQEALEYVIPYFRYYDEILALLCIPLFIINIMNKTIAIEKIDRTTKTAITSLMGLTAIGLASNFIFKYQPLLVSISDLFLILKFPMALISISLIINNEILNDENSKKYLSRYYKLITLFFIILSALNYIYTLFPSEYRFGIMSNKLFYSHPAKLLCVCIFLLLSLIYTNKKPVSFYGAILVLISLSTLRMKSIGFLVLLLILGIYIAKRKKVIPFHYFIIAGIILFATSYKQISVYFLNNTKTARYQLLNKSISIANDHFPFGSGFGTYGSYMSVAHYSPVYYNYGLNTILGISENNYLYATDSFWPVILAQTGYIGLLCYILFIFMLYKKINKEHEFDQKLYLCKFLALTYLLLSSVSDPSFMNSSAILFCFIIGIKPTKKVKR